MDHMGNPNLHFVLGYNSIDLFTCQKRGLDRVSKTMFPPGRGYMTCGWMGVCRPVFRKPLSFLASGGRVLSIFVRQGCAVFQGIVVA